MPYEQQNTHIACPHWTQMRADVRLYYHMDYRKHSNNLQVFRYRHNSSFTSINPATAAPSTTFSDTHSPISVQIFLSSFTFKRHENQSQWGWITAFNCATNTPFAVSPANRSEMWPLVQVCDLGREGSCVSNTWMGQSFIYWNYRPRLEEFTQDKLAEGLWRFTASESEMEEWTDASGRLEISQEGSESIREAVDETRLMMTFEKSREQTSQSWSIMCSSSA